MTRSIFAPWIVAAGLCAVPPQPAQAAFAIVDSGAWVMSGGNRTIYWLDDQRLLFVGHDRIKPTSDREADPALLEWQIGKETRILRKGVDTLCYRHGQVMYAVRSKPGAARAFYQGTLGRETSVEPKHTDSMSCDVTAERPDRATNRAVLPLRRGDGYLDLGARTGPGTSDNTPIFHYAEGAREGTHLPFGRNEFHAPEYYEFKGAYFVGLSYVAPSKNIGTTAWPKGGMQTAYWLWPDGRTEKVQFPSDIGGAQPTRAGILYRVPGPRNSIDVYLLIPGREREQVVQGYVTQIAVSPDGCGAAFSYAPNQESDMWRPHNRRTLKAVNLCRGR